jgi:hypothetical protein
MRHRMIVDCESSSLTPDYHTGSGVIWELALGDCELVVAGLAVIEGRQP